MADYYTPTVVQQTIPNSAMSPLERLLLTNMFSADVLDDKYYFHAADGPETTITLEWSDLEAAIAASEDQPSCTLPTIQEQLAHREPDQTDVDLDLSGMSWEDIFQDIVRRSPDISYISVLSSFTCTKPRSDGFGGMAVLITATQISGKSTNDILEELMEEAEVGHFAPAATASIEAARE